MEIFSHALRYFRDHALRELSDQAGVAVLEEDVRWVITVPAIWSHPAKQFMRNAAYQVDINFCTPFDRFFFFFFSSALNKALIKSNKYYIYQES